MPSIEDFSSDDLLDDIISAALEYEGQFREAFIGYINQAAESAEMLDILQDIASGEIIDITPSVEEALRRINISTDNLTDILRQTMESVARTTVESVGVDMVFDMISPTAIDYANKMAARSITNVSTAAQQSIREVLRQVLQQDMTIAQMRRFVNSRVGLLPSHIGAVQRYYRTLIDGGTPFRRAQVLADEYASRLRTYRADMITRTEIAAAQSWGQWATWQQMRDEKLIPLDAFRIWMTAQDERVCDVCGPMNRQVTSLDGQWDTPNGPVTLPTDIHPNCRCAMGITFSRGRAREFLGKGPSTDYDWWMIEKHLAGTSQDHDQSTHGRRQSIKEGITFGEEYREWVKANNMAEYDLYDDSSLDLENMFDKDFGKARSNIVKALKDDVARALGGYIESEMTTAELVDALVQVSLKKRGLIVGSLGYLLQPPRGMAKTEYEIDDISLIMLKQAVGSKSSGNSGLPFLTPEAIQAGLDLGLEGMVDQGLVPSRWVLEQAKAVFGENSSEVIDLARQISITGETLKEHLFGANRAVWEMAQQELPTQGGAGLAQAPSSKDLAALTEETVGKIVDTMMREGGEDARPAVADFLKAAYNEAGIAVSRQTDTPSPHTIKLTSGVGRPASDSLKEPDFDRSGRNGASELANEVATRLVVSWAQSSSSHESTLMMQAAVSELGASPGYRPDDYSLGRDYNYRLDQMGSEAQKLVKTVVRAQYEMTQQMFREIGIEEVTIARGMSFSFENRPYDWQRGTLIYEANAVLRPLSSWSIDVKDAKSFARGAQILFQRVPVERIFSTPMTGLGCFKESECLFIYKDGDVFPIFDLSNTYIDRPDQSELVRIINDYDFPTISKADLPTVYPDARIEDADWAKRTFDFPDVTTTKQYREKFGLQDDEALAEHISEWKDTPYWEGIPSKIKVGLLKARLSKHLGNEHDQKTHGSWAYQSPRGGWHVVDQTKDPSKYAGDDEEFAKAIFEVELEHEDYPGVTFQAVIGGVDPRIEEQDPFTVYGKVVTDDGNHVGEFERRIDPLDNKVKNVLFTLEPEYQGRGLGTTLSLHWEDQLHRAGIILMTTEATSSVSANLNGGYTWLKYGYQPGAGVNRELVRAWLQSSERSHLTSSEVREELVDIANEFGVASLYDTPMAREAAVGRTFGHFATVITETSRDSAEPLLMLASVSESFTEWLKTKAEWYGYKTTEPIDLSLAKAQKTVAQVLREWNINNPAAVESDDPEFWQAIRNAFGKVSKHLPNQHDQMTHGRRKASSAYTVKDDTYITVRYGNYEGQHSPVGYLAEADSYYMTELDDFYDDMPDVKRGDIDGHLKFIAEDAMKRWFYYGPQSMMRTIASSMMEVGHFGSNGDEQYMEKYGDDVMDKIYSGDGPAELTDEFLLPTVALLRSAALAEPSEREWFRGMVIDTKSPILRMAEGDRFVMPPSSFGGHRDIALAFTRGGQQEPTAQMMEREEASVFNIEWRDVVFRLEPGAQGTLSSDTVSRTPGGEGFPFEIVANGEFEVVSVDSPFYDYEGAEDELVEITIRHVTTYDPLSGEYIEVG